ncbi:MAG: Tex family protein [Jaaginema sp. PMC 1079.18]|nr:Tex family protein [Jaaginema sp. PMC 1080.18]MEC4852434.1 Tex family protein [Jaaginema sp. PMC 1079.18]MEC4865576.1 Tex family protein [Jaaginema sp. PMC 1078.18]
MLNLTEVVAQELNLNLHSVDNALQLAAEGATVPFIARYRKERTGGLDETQLRDLFERHSYLSELAKRKQAILEAITAQGKLTEALRSKIIATTQKNELEDLYLPYRPKRRTRATMAKEKGLEPLADWIAARNRPNVATASLTQEAQKYVAPDQKVNSPEDALQGASDILAEAIAENSELRSEVRAYLYAEGTFASKVKGDYPEGTTKYEMYRSFQAPVKSIPAHNLLALLRGEAESILTVDLAFDEERILSHLEDKVIATRDRVLRNFYQETVKEAFKRLMKNSLISEVRSQCKQQADLESITAFETNLRQLLLASPAGMKPTLALDPGFRTGCKVAVLDRTGKFMETATIYPHTGAGKKAEAVKQLQNLINKYKIELIAIGNGTASRETDAFVGEVLKVGDRNPIKVIVNESGASIYSASEVARSEFPDLDLTVRGAISIGRRLQDPLAELVKIDPKSIGVGQYQHDVDQKLLKQKLEETVESCVNYVGVDLNTASKELLTFVSGLTPTIAQNIVNFRNEKGEFTNRKQLLKIAKLGAKTFEQAAGFLRIRAGTNPLDNTSVHPESYSLVEGIAQDLNLSLQNIEQFRDRLPQINLKNYVTETTGLPTLKDIIAELEKPGRDPREQFKYATFKEGINEITDLAVGMELEGVVTNVVNFGAFVDIGVHQDGLVHISQLANRFVNDPKTVVKVGQVVKVKVLEINEKLKRISLSMKAVN